MISLISAVALTLGQDLASYDFVARDNFAAWYFASDEVVATGEFRTTSVLIRYNVPAALGTEATPVAYSVYRVTFDCAEASARYVRGTNHSGSGAIVSSAGRSADQPWNQFEPGFQTLAETVCTMQVENRGF